MTADIKKTYFEESEVNNYSESVKYEESNQSEEFTDPGELESFSCVLYLVLVRRAPAEGRQVGVRVGRDQ